MKRLFLMLPLLGLPACAGQPNFVAPPPGTVNVSGGCSSFSQAPNLAGLAITGLLAGQAFNQGGWQGTANGLAALGGALASAGSSNISCYQQFGQPEGKPNW